MEHLAQSKEDYLESILLIRDEKGYCHSVDIARRLSVSKPRVSVALKKLESIGYVWRDRSDVRLTDSGLAIAENTLKKHRFFREFFIDLGVNPDTADHDACLVKHRVSDETLRMLKKWWDSTEKNAAP